MFTDIIQFALDRRNFQFLLFFKWSELSGTDILEIKEALQTSQVKKCRFLNF